MQMNRGCADSEKNKKTTLVLTQTDPGTDMMFQAWLAYGLKADIIFSKQCKIVRLIRRLWVDHFLPGYHLWYGEWKKTIADYETVIIHASERTRTLPTWIRKKKADMRIIYWYWNPVNKKSLPTLVRDPATEFWSFDVKDCLFYKMNQNIQYYYELFEGKPIRPAYDIYYIGHDKGREKIIRDFEHKAKALGISCRIDLVKQSDSKIPYSEVVQRISKCVAILEINQAGQSGLTLRALEALFLNKKLITNNPLIQKEKFYSPKNIFIIGKDALNNIGYFIESEYDNSVSKYKQDYDINAWLNNFF